MKRSIVNEGSLPGLLARFYERVRRDPELGPVFEDAVHDWPAHLVRLTDFWSSVMLISGRYKGNPVAEHVRHADRITGPMFDQWLAIWQEITDELLAPDEAAKMQAKASRIAKSLQLALKLRSPMGRAEALGHPKPYRSTPVFDASTLPSAFRRAHRTKPGVWGVIRVVEGRIAYSIEDGTAPVVLTPERPGLIRPAEPHHVQPIGDARMRVDFYEAEPFLA